VTDRRFYFTSEKIRYQREENDRKVFESLPLPPVKWGQINGCKQADQTQ